MVGSQALVAYQQADGKIKAHKSPITQYKTDLEEGELAFDVSDLTATYANNEMIIFATVGLKNATTTLNQVWQEGPLSGNAPTMHSITEPNVQSVGSLDLVSGQAGTSAGGQEKSKLRKRNIHGVINTVTWGLLMPIGIIIERYLKVFKSAGPAWFTYTCLANFLQALSVLPDGLPVSNSAVKPLYFLPWNTPGVCFAFEAKTRSQIQNLPELLPPFSWICNCHSQCDQHIQRIQHLEPR